MTAPAFAKGHRGALLIGTGTYEHPTFDALRSPAVDCSRLAEVLADEEIGAFDVQQLIDADLTTLMRAIEQFFGRQAQPDDFRLLYLSCHGFVNDRDDTLHFAVRTTDPEWPASSSIPAAFVHNLMKLCWARSIVVVLDCCYSGRFLPGAKGGTPAEFEEALAGHGRVVITAGTRTQLAYEGEHSDPSAPALSRFTEPFVEGLRTGAADRNGDGFVSVRELYDYVCERLHAQKAQQNPRFGGELQYDIALARVKPKPRPNKSRKKRTPRPAPERVLPWRTPAALGAARQPVLADGMLVVHEGYRLHVIDPKSRTRRPLIEMKFPGIPAFHDDAVYFAGKDGALQAFDLHTGRPRPCRRLTVGDGLLGIADGVLYAATPLSRLYAVNLRTDDDLWPSLKCPEVTFLCASKISGGTVLLLAREWGLGGDRVGVIDPVHGTMTWSHKVEQLLAARWSVVSEGIHLVQSRKSASWRIITLDPKAEKTVWTHESPAALAAAPAAADGFLVFGDVGNQLVALDARTGESCWKQRTRGRLLTRPVIVDGTLYTADRAATLTAWRLRDGRKLRSHDILLSHDPDGCPVSAQGTLYVTDSRGYLHGLPIS
ncbi:PQQ-binding-like beta-propeller repeat protein [Streptomyces sp. NRRL B-24085]|uniref:caspase, EACC1-associated type n=1 Tax=Streptomyces sp. NRRL B-24085 TaxID=1709476 RepID=UPI0006B2F13B|nr:PQQ-binding-like beta-propeller repeat protein [Streptomyces sp. NRRL B-24085]